MIALELNECEAMLSALITAIESSARAFGERLGAAGRAEDHERAALAPVLASLQINDLTAQRATRCREALELLAALDQPALIAPGCRLQTLQLAAASAAFRTALAALASAVPARFEPGEPGHDLQQIAERLEAITARLESLAAPETTMALRAAVVERLQPAYTMASERAVLAQFLGAQTPGGEAALPQTPEQAESLDDFFL